MNKAGVYIHVPFCSGKCFYCDFYSSPGNAAAMNAYTDAVCRHIAQAPRAEADTVYFGGGTPSLIGAENLIRILKTVENSFVLSENSQVTFEANPGDICMSPGVRGSEAEALEMLRGAGFDRISLGVQASQDSVLKYLGRRHDFRQAERVVALARSSGFEDISLDLMYGLPDQTISQWEESIYAVMAMNPTHISCYSLKLDEAVPLFREIGRLPDDDVQYEMYIRLIEILSSHGYEQYEISNFAKKGYRSRHNMKYWTGAEYYGFGPSAHSFINSTRYAYCDDTAAYIEGHHPYKEYSILTEEDFLEEYILLGLRTVNGISSKRLCQRFNVDPSPVSALFDKYTRLGMAGVDGDRFFLTPKGFFVSNTIIVEILENLL